MKHTCVTRRDSDFGTGKVLFHAAKEMVYKQLMHLVLDSASEVQISLRKACTSAEAPISSYIVFSKRMGREL